MKGILLDENLPARISLPTRLKVIHVRDVDNCKTDSAIWEFAKENNLAIVTKDADFSFLIAHRLPPPRVVQLRLGNMRLVETKAYFSLWWPKIESHLQYAKLIHVFKERLEIIA